MEHYLHIGSGPVARARKKTRKQKQATKKNKKNLFDRGAILPCFAITQTKWLRGILRGWW